METPISISYLEPFFCHKKMSLSDLGFTDFTDMNAPAFALGYNFVHLPRVERCLPHPLLGAVRSRAHSHSSRHADEVLAPTTA